MNKNTFYSQIGQDRYYVENIVNFKQNGFFLDIGAHDGLSQSNTAYLEFNLNWSGICVEANSELIVLLKENRPNSVVLEYAAWDKEELLEFETTNSNRKKQMEIYLAEFRD